VDPGGAVNWIMRGLMDDRSAVSSSALVVADRIVAVVNDDAYSDPMEHSGSTSFRCQREQ